MADVLAVEHHAELEVPLGNGEVMEETGDVGPRAAIVHAGPVAAAAMSEMKGSKVCQSSTPVKKRLTWERKRASVCHPAFQRGWARRRNQMACTSAAFGGGPAPSRL